MTSPLVAGEAATLTVSGAPAGALVRFFYSTAGSGAGPCHPVFGVCTELLEPLEPLGRVRADASGVAVRVFTLPEGAPGVAYVQAFVADAGAVTATNLLAEPVLHDTPDTGDTAAPVDTGPPPARRLWGPLDVTAAAAKLKGEDKWDQAASSMMGQSLAFAQDVNGDGFGDLLVSAEYAGPLDRGRAYLLYGPITGSTSLAAADVIFEADLSDGYFGRAVAGLGDLDSDGFADVAVGVALADTIGGNDGAILIWYGASLAGTLTPSSADARIYGDPGGFLGQSAQPGRSRRRRLG